MIEISINGKTYKSKNGDVNIVGGKVTIDGVDQNDNVSGVVEVIVLKGSIQNLTTDASVTCGDVGHDVRAEGSVKASNIGANIHAGGSVQAANVAGNITAGGSVRSNSVQGFVKSSGVFKT